MPTTPHNLRVAVLAYDGLATFEFGIAVELFGLPRPEFPTWYEMAVCAAEPGPLRAVGGFLLSGIRGLEALRGVGTIVVPGWGADRPVTPGLADLLRAEHAAGARILTICSGAFLPAAAGLLDGRRATTHWRHAERLARDYPAVRVEPDVLYVDEGALLTSAGSAAGLDLGLHLIRADFGPRIANEVARRLVVAPHRAGGQAQFIDRPMPADGGRLSGLLDWIDGHLDEELDIGRLAARAALSPRTLIRRFKETTGQAPAAWIAERRLARARDLLEGTALAIEEIATRCGYGTADTLRHHFRRHGGLSPTQYRRAFRRS